MAATINISAYEAVGSAYCVASDDGQRVHDRISAAIKAGRSVSVSFLNVQLVTTAFLNAAFGQLYGLHSEEVIRSLVKVKDMEPEDVGLLKRVIDSAKLYFKDPARFEKTINDVVGVP